MMVGTVLGACAGSKDEPEKTDSGKEIAGAKEDDGGKTEETPAPRELGAGNPTNDKPDSICMRPEFMEGEPIEIEWGYYMKYEDDNWYQNRIQDAFNVKIKHIDYDLGNGEVMAAKAASGDFPEAGFYWSYTGYGNALKLYQDAVTRSIPKEYIREYAPYISNMMDNEPPAWDLGRSPDNPDEYLSMLTYAWQNIHPMFCNIYNLDWLENLGIEPNGELVECPDGGNPNVTGRVFWTDTPFTFEQHTEILEKFTYGDPDQNGEDDTYGMTGYIKGNDRFTWAPISSHFGFVFADNGINFNVDGKVQEYYTTDMYKDFLKYARKIVEEGWIDPDWASMDHGKAMEKHANDKFGHAYFHGGVFNAAVPDLSASHGARLVKNPKAKLLVTPPVFDLEKDIVGPYGHHPWGVGGLYVSKKVDDEKLKRIIAIWDFMNGDDKESIYSHMGRDGIDYEWISDPWDLEKGRIRNLLPDAKAYGEAGVACYIGFFYKKSSWYTMQPDITRMVADWAMSDAGQKVKIHAYKSDIANETNLNKLASKYGGATTTIKDEFFFNALTGRVDIDKDWDGYIKHLNEATKYDERMQELDKVKPLSEWLGW